MFHVPTLEKRHHVSSKDFVSLPTPPSPASSSPFWPPPSRQGSVRNAHPEAELKCAGSFRGPPPDPPPEMSKEIGREGNVRPEDVEIQSVV